MAEGEGIAQGIIWHKPTEKAAWMRRYIVSNGPSIRIYGTRDEFNSHAEPLYTIELLSDSEFRSGSDNVIRMGFLTKKGKLQWTQRWAVLLKSGHINYTDNELKGHRSFDIAGSTVAVTTGKNYQIEIKVKGDKHESFRFGSEKDRDEWIKDINAVIKTCDSHRDKKSLNMEPTLYPFTIAKPGMENHYFCVADENELQRWKKHLSLSIAGASHSVGTPPPPASPSMTGMNPTTPRDDKDTKDNDESLGRLSTLRKGASRTRITTTSAGVTDEELDAQFMKLIEELKIPEKGRPQMMKLGREQKEKMLEEHQERQKKKPRQDPKTWANKFVAGSGPINANTLQTFGVILRDEKPIFALAFIRELGLNHLCRLAREGRFANDMLFCKELVNVFKALVDLEGTMPDMIRHDNCIRVIVDQLNVNDTKTREQVVKLLASMVGYDGDECYLAATKVLEALTDNARVFGERNRWKRMIGYLSTKDRLQGSMAYDTWTITLINYLLSTLSDEKRIDERRLLEALRFDKLLTQLEDSVRRQSLHVNSEEEMNTVKTDSGNLLKQIEVYRQLADEDHRQGNITEAELDATNPKDLFNRVHDQALKDGFINELTKILTNLVALPPDADQVWWNITRIVGDACQPVQMQMLEKAEHNTTDKSGKQALLSVKHQFKNRTTTQAQLTTTKADDAMYPSYQELKHLLNVRETDPQQQKKTKESERIEQLENSKLQMEKELEKLQAQLVQYQKGGVVVTQSGGNTTTTSTAPTTAPSTSSGDASASGGEDQYAKYRKMLKMGMPKQSVINKMIQDKVDKGVIEVMEKGGDLPMATGGSSTASSSDGNAGMPSNPVAALIAGKASGGGSTAGASTSSSASATLTPEEEAKVAPYRKMQKINMPQQSIINKMVQDGIDKALIDKMFGGGKDAKSDGAKKKEEPQLPPGLKPKKVIQPGVKMRNLHWTPLNPFDVEKTIWKDINDESIKLDVKDLENNFCWKEIERKTPEKTETNTEEAEKVTVLDSKRGYNVEIFLGRLKMDNWAIRDAMLKMDENVLPIDKINKLVNFVPTPEEAELISQYEETPNLGTPEMYFKIIKSVDTNLKQRLELWSFKIQFSEEVKTEQEKIEAVNRGVQSLRKSNNFKKILTYVLAIGNYMNGGTKNGAAFGFKLNSLTQLSRSRTVDNKQTLLQYLYVWLEQKDIKVLEFTNDLTPLDDATTVDLATLRTNMSTIRSRLGLIQTRLKQAEADPTKVKRGDQFIAVMTPFYNSASKTFEGLDKQFQKLQQELQTVGEWLNEGKDINGEYLKTVNSFRREITACGKQLAQQREKEKNDALREEFKKQQKAKPKSSNKNLLNESSSIPPPPSENQLRTHPDRDKNVSDAILKSLQIGTSDELLQRLKARKKKLVDPSAMQQQ